MDSDSSPNGRPDAGETIHYTIVVTNNGTVTLKNVEATSLTSGPVSCTDHLGRTLSQPVADLGVLEWYKCAGSHSVRAWRGRMWVRAMLLRLDQLVSSARRKAHHVREAVRVCWLSSGLVCWSDRHVLLLPCCAGGRGPGQFRLTALCGSFASMLDDMYRCTRSHKQSSTQGARRTRCRL